MPKQSVEILLLTAAFLALAVCRSSAQDEWLATVKYQNLVIGQTGQIPGVTWVLQDNSTYDQNHQRFFFQGNANRTSSWLLYTIDAVSGATLYNPVCPSNNPAGLVVGLQYDNNTDTLYGLYLTGGASYFSWIEPATGIVHIIQALSRFGGYNGSSFDIKDHLYICNISNGLLVIDAGTGNVVYNPAFSTSSRVTDLLFDNLTGLLYGIWTSSLLSNPQFVSIDPVTGVENLIANLPALSIPQINAYTIDEGAGKYIFVGSDPPSSACVRNYLYVIDIATGNILSRTLYPYAQDIDISSENLIEYSFDNKQGILYALHWYPPASNVNPYVNIMASQDTVCAGDTAAFTATPGASIVNPSYQWIVNSNKTGENSPEYENNALDSGDTVYCILTNGDPCSFNQVDTSNRIIIRVKSSEHASLSILASSTTICSGDTVTFTATSVANGGNNPSFLWQVNGRSAGSGKDSFMTNSLVDADRVSCILTSSMSCAAPVASTDTITMNVNPSPTVTMGNDTVIRPGSSVLLDPTITGIIADFQWTPVTGLKNPSVAHTVATPAASTGYQLMVTTDKGCITSGKINIFVYSQLGMPNAFTPNGDGHNDVFSIPSSSPQKIFNFSVFNRWGQRMFMTEKSGIGWDGRSNNQAQDAGTYVWEIEYMDLLTGRHIWAKGTVLLIR